MAIICAICGKKQSGWYMDYALSADHEEHRICIKCEEMLEFLRDSGSIDEKYTAAKTYFEEYRISDSLADEVKECLIGLMENAQTARDEYIYRRDHKEEILQKELEQKQAEEEEIRKKQQYRNHMYSNCPMTTGFNFEGYRITKYHKVISAETVLGTGFLSDIKAEFSDLLGTHSGAYSSALQKAREVVTRDLVNQLLSYNGNALIGIDFDYITFTGNMIGVVGTATAVTIEPERI